MKSAHSETATENGAIPGAVSPTPSLSGTGGPFVCSQCTSSFPSKDQLEKHELLHSPNAQVVSRWFSVFCYDECRMFSVGSFGFSTYDSAPSSNLIKTLPIMHKSILNSVVYLMRRTLINWHSKVYFN